MARSAQARALPRTIWVLGATSLLMDTSSEMVHAILPLFLVAGLGATPAVVGLIDGIANATASVAKIFSGALSDYWRNRKALAALGYGLSAASKILFPIADSAFMVLAGRFVDRMGKGVRDAPRDALIADWITPAQRGYAYGMRQMLDNIGAVAGPALALLLLQLHRGQMTAVLWWALLPGIAAAAVIAIGAKEPPVARKVEKPRFPLRPSEMARLGGAFWLLMAILFLLLLPRVSDAFLLLRGNNLGLTIAWTPVVLVVMNAASVPVTLWAGILSDRIGRPKVIALGFAVLAAAHCVLAFATTPAFALVGAALWGVHLGMTEGVFSALVADRAPAELRGTAFGAFNLAAGVAVLAGSWGMGLVWDGIGPAQAFTIAAALSLAGTALLWLRLRAAG
ncbi:MAG TPA: MFS transporter [Candidatus Cybelea sp.]|nr:MFS transporter [Candidatus Cybelea sp.]